MKNILIKIVAGVVLMPMLVYGQVNTMYFCCSYQIGGGCTPIAYPTETACKAACTETQRCEVRTAPAAPVAPPATPHDYSAYDAGTTPNISALNAAINAAAQSGAVPTRSPVTTTVSGMPVQQATAPATTVTTTTVQRATPTTAAKFAAANTVGTGTSATTVHGNQVI